MAGATLTIDVDDTEATALFGRLRQYGTAIMRETGGDIGEYLLRSTRERAAKQESPDGVPWVPLSAKYAAYKQKKRPGVPILKFDAHMLGDRLAYQVGDDYVQIGTNVVYGAIHQFGGTVRRASYSRVSDKALIGSGQAKIPARPYLGLSEADRTELGEILKDHLQAAIDGG